MLIQVRKSGERGYFDYGWLKTYHSFSFGQYEDQNYRGFRFLRIINENFLLPGVGFPLHSHQDMEIFSIVMKGGITHQDDLGNGSILRSGKIQLLSTGRGITHSELNASDKDEAHFWQFWILPNGRKLKPAYQEKFFPFSSRQNKWCLIISGDGRDGSLHIHQDTSIYYVSLDEGKELSYHLNANRYGWIQLIKGELDVCGVQLQEGDGASISEATDLVIKSQATSEFVFMELN